VYENIVLVPGVEFYDMNGLYIPRQCLLIIVRLSVVFDPHWPEGVSTYQIRLPTTADN